MESGPVSLGASELAARIAGGELSSQEVVEAHIARIEEVCPRLNAVVVPLFEQARADAARADAARAAGQTLGPLHGVPVTIKECIDVAGTASTLGVTSRVGQLAAADAPLVTRLRNAGAVVLGKTNVPQLLLYAEADSPVYGRTNNPWNLERAPGGSSGGEAAIIAAGGSPLGLGTDIGGSVRIPAHHCGIQALKPTSRRLTTVGTGEIYPGQEGILDSPGPMARTVADLSLAMSVLAAREKDQPDPDVPPAPPGEAASALVEGMRIGFYTDDGFLSPSPALRRAVREAAAALEGHGASVEEWQPLEATHAVELYFGILGADGGAALRRHLAGSEVDRRAGFPARIARAPTRVRPALAALARVTGQRRLAKLARAWGRRSADEYWRLLAEARAYRLRFAAALGEHGFDALLSPAHALPALTHGASADLGVTHNYNSLYNLLGMPAGVVAATRVRSGEESDRRVRLERADRVARQVERGSAGLPVGVQVAARHWQEHVVLAVMGALEQHFRAQPDYPGRPPL